MDAALPAKATAAGDALLNKADAYVKVLASAAGAEADPLTKGALKTMEGEILKLVKAARDDLEEHVEPAFVGTFKNQLPSGFGSQWLVDRLPMQGFTLDRKLSVSLDMCKAQFIANPYKLDTDKRKFANFHRQVDAAVHGTTTEINTTVDPRWVTSLARCTRYPSRRLYRFC